MISVRVKIDDAGLQDSSVKTNLIENNVFVFKNILLFIVHFRMHGSILYVCALKSQTDLWTRPPFMVFSLQTIITNCSTMLFLFYFFM